MKFEVIGGVGFQVVVPGPPLSALIGLHSVAPREADQLHYPQHRIPALANISHIASDQLGSHNNGEKCPVNNFKPNFYNGKE